MPESAEQEGQRERSQAMVNEGLEVRGLVVYAQQAALCLNPVTSSQRAGARRMLGFTCVNMSRLNILPPHRLFVLSLQQGLLPRASRLLQLGASIFLVRIRTGGLGPGNSDSFLQ